MMTMTMWGSTRMTDAGPPAAAAPPPLQADPNASSGSLFEFNRPTVVALLYFATWFTGFSCVLGVILAYVWRAEPLSDWERSHHDYHIRTFWMLLGLVAGALMLVIVVLLAAYPSPPSQANDAVILLTLIAVGLLLMVGLVWLALRCVNALIKAQCRRPMPRPATWLV